MRLLDLLKGVPHEPHGAANPEIAGIAYDSRRVQPGYLFCAIPGQSRDGAEFIPEAVSRGAAAILSSKDVSLPCPWVKVQDILRSMALVSNTFFGEPSKSLSVIAVTGTNGKTTITYLLEAILAMAGKSCGIIGTISYRLGERKWPAPHTTPLSADLQALLQEMLHSGATHVAMEVSSHALALKRVDGTHFKTGIFTNLTQDHLDFHQTMKEYFQAKARLFELMAEQGESKSKTAIINLDDPWGKKLIGLVNFNILTYGSSAPCDLRATSIELGVSGTRFQLQHKGKARPVHLKLLGKHNVENALAAIAAALTLGVDEQTAVAAVEKMSGVPGRFERVGAGSPTVLVDYAHTEDALRHALETLKALKPRRLLVVFGCGGDRDRGKRPAMGETAGRLADAIVLTSDNPRTEDPNQIILDIEVGLRKVRKEGYEIVPDRQEAIKRAISAAEPDDVVLIAGKGHETTQITRDRVVPFDDRMVALNVLKELSSSRS